MTRSASASARPRHDLGPAGPDPLYGYGMVDAAAAVDGCFGRATGSAVTVDPAVAPSGTGTAQCADGQVVLGGGVEWSSVPEGAVVSVQSSFPSAPGAWSATVTVEGLPATFVVRAACGSAPSGYASARGELVTAGPLVEDPLVSGSEAEPAIATATAQCPDGQVVLGGGVEWSSVPEGAVVSVQSSFPSAPGAWSATATIGGQSATFAAWAVCAIAPAGYEQAQGPGGPVTAVADAGFQTVNVPCTAGRVALAGGFRSVPAIDAVARARGSFPAGDGTAWVVEVASSGADTAFDVWAVCA